MIELLQTKIVLLGKLVISLTALVSLYLAPMEAPIFGAVEPVLGAIPIRQEKWWNVDVNIYEGKKRVGTFVSGWKNYCIADGCARDGGWATIDRTISTSTSGEFTMETAPMFLYLPERSIGEARLHNNNKFNANTRKEITDSPLDMTIKALGVNDVPGILKTGDLIIAGGLVSDAQYVEYEGAYSNGDLIYYFQFGENGGSDPRLNKLVRMNDRNGGTYEFELGFSDPVNLNIMRGVPKDILPIPKGKTSQALSRVNSERGFGFYPVHLWDGNPDDDERNIEELDTEIRRQGLKYIQKKEVPVSSANWQLPIYTDTVSTFNPATGSGGDSMDATAQGQENQNWATTREGNAASIDARNATNLRVLVNTNTSDSDHRLQRAFMTFLTGDTINGGTVNEVANTKLTVRTVTENNFEAGETVVLGHTSLADTNDLVVADFNNIDGLSGAITDNSDRQDPAGVGSDTTLTLNSTGVGNVATAASGVSEFVIIDATRDADDVEPAVNEDNFKIVSSDAGGVIPELSVDFTEAAAIVTPYFWSLF